MNEQRGSDPPIDQDKIRTVVRRLIRTAASEPAAARPKRSGKARAAAYADGITRVLDQVRVSGPRIDEDKAQAAEDVQRLLSRHPVARYAALVARPELSRPAVAEQLLDRVRDAVAESSSSAIELAQLALGAACRFSGAHHPASLTIGYLGEAWLLLALAHLGGRRQSEANEAFHVATALLVGSEQGPGDASVAAELLVVEGLLEFSGGNWGESLQSFQEAVSAYASAGQPARARAAARLLAEASLGRPLLSALSPRALPPLPGDARRGLRRPLSHLFAVWQVLRAPAPGPSPEEAA